MLDASYLTRQLLAHSTEQSISLLLLEPRALKDTYDSSTFFFHVFMGKSGIYFRSDYSTVVCSFN